MAVTYHNAGSPVASTGGIPSLGLPGGWQENDILLLAVTTKGNDTASVTSPGWEFIGVQASNTGTTTYFTKLWLYWKRATASESDVVLADAGSLQYAIVTSWRGVKTTGSPFSGVSGSSKGALNTSVAFPPVNAIVNGSMIAFCASAGDNTSFSSWSCSLGTPTERVDTQTSAGSDATLAIASIPADDGDTVTTATAVTAAAESNACFSLVFEPERPDVAVISLTQEDETATTGVVNEVAASTGLIASVEDFETAPDNDNTYIVNQLSGNYASVDFGTTGWPAAFVSFKGEDSPQMYLEANVRRVGTGSTTVKVYAEIVPGLGPYATASGEATAFEHNGATEDIYYQTVRIPLTFSAGAYESPTPAWTEGKVRLVFEEPNSLTFDNTVRVSSARLVIENWSEVPLPQKDFILSSDGYSFGVQNQSGGTTNLYQSVDEGVPSQDSDTTYLINVTGIDNAVWTAPLLDFPEDFGGAGDNTFVKISISYKRVNTGSETLILAPIIVDSTLTDLYAYTDAAQPQVTVHTGSTDPAYVVRTVYLKISPEGLAASKAQWESSLISLSWIFLTPTTYDLQIRVSAIDVSLLQWEISTASSVLETPDPATTQATGHAPKILVSVTSATQKGEVEVTGNAPQILLSDNKKVAIPAASVPITAYDASIPFVSVKPSAATVSAFGFSPSKVGIPLAAITYVGAGTVSSGIQTVAPGVVPGYANDDIFLLHVNHLYSHTLTVPAGWELIKQVTAPNDGTGAIPTHSVYWKRVSGVQSAPTVTVSPESSALIARISGWRNCEPTSDPYYFVGEFSESVITDYVDFGGAISAEAGSAFVFSGASGRNTSASGGWSNTEAPVTEIFLNTQNTAPTSTLHCAYRLSASKSDYSGISRFRRAHSSRSVGFTIVLRPKGADIPSTLPRPPPEYQGSDTPKVAGGSPMVLVKPEQAKDGDLLLLHLSTRGGETPSLPAGYSSEWTLLGSSTHNAAGAAGTEKQTVYWKEVGAGNTSYETVTMPLSPLTRLSGYMTLWRHVDIVNGPIQAIQASFENVANEAVTATGLTTSKLRTLVAALWHGGHTSWGFVLEGTWANANTDYLHDRATVTLSTNGGDVSRASRAWGLMSSPGPTGDFTVPDMTSEFGDVGMKDANLVVAFEPFFLPGPFEVIVPAATINATGYGFDIGWVTAQPSNANISVQGYAPLLPPFIQDTPKSVSSTATTGRLNASVVQATGVPYAWLPNRMSYNFIEGNAKGTSPFYEGFFIVGAQSHQDGEDQPWLDGNALAYMNRSSAPLPEVTTSYLWPNYSTFNRVAESGGFADYVSLGGTGVDKYQAIAALHHVNTSDESDYAWAHFVVNSSGGVTDVGTPPWYVAQGQATNWVGMFYGRNVSAGEGYLIGLRQSGGYTLPCIYAWLGGTSWTAGTDLCTTAEEGVVFNTKIIGWCRADQANPDRIYVICTTENASTGSHLNLKVFAVDLGAVTATRIVNNSTDYDNGTWNFEGDGDGHVTFGRPTSNPTRPKIHGQGTARDEERCRPVSLDTGDYFYFRTKDAANQRTYTRIGLNSTDWTAPSLYDIEAGVQPFPTAYNSTAGQAYLERWVMHGIVWSGNSVYAVMVHAQGSFDNEWDSYVFHFSYRSLTESPTGSFSAWKVFNKEYLFKPDGGNATNSWWFQDINGGVRNWGQDANGVPIGFSIRFAFGEYTPAPFNALDQTYHRTIHTKWWEPAPPYAPEFLLHAEVSSAATIQPVIDSNFTLSAEADISSSFVFDIVSSKSSGGSFYLEGNTQYLNFALEAELQSVAEFTYALNDINFSFQTAPPIGLTANFANLPTGVQYREYEHKYLFSGTEWHEEFLGIVNAQRAGLGLAPFKQPDLEFWQVYSRDIATEHNDNMMAARVLGHESTLLPPGQQLLSERSQLAGYKAASENVFFDAEWTFSPEYLPSVFPFPLTADVYPTPQEAYDIWFSSPLHRSNMLYDWGESAEVYSTMAIGTLYAPQLVDITDVIDLSVFTVGGFVYFFTNVFADVTIAMETRYFEGYHTFSGAKIELLDAEYELKAYVDVRSDFDISYSIKVGAQHRFPYASRVSRQHAFPVTYNVRSEHSFLYSETSDVAAQHTFVYRIQDTTPVKAQQEFLYSYRVVSAHEFSYGTGVSVRSQHIFLYEPATKVVADHVFPYAATGRVAAGHTFTYAMTVHVATGHEFTFDIKDVNNPKSEHRFFYNLSSPAVMNTVADSNIRIGTWLFDYVEVDLNQDEDSVPWLARCEIADEATFAKIKEGDACTLSLQGEEWSLVVTEKTVERQFARARYILKMESSAVFLMSPRADVSSYSFDTAIDAQVAVEQILGQSVSWEILPWTIPSGRLVLEDTTPMDAALAIVAPVRGLIQSRPDGSLVVRYLYPYAMDKLSLNTISHTFTDTDDNLSLSQSFEYRSGANRIRIMEGESTFSDTLEWVPEEDDPTRGELRAYLSPWRTDYTLRQTTPGSGTYYRLRGTVSRTEVAVVEFVEGSAPLNYPISSLSSVTWLSDPLGAIFFDPYSKTISSGSAVNNGYGLAEIEYVVEADVYDVTGVIGKYAQFIIEDGE